MIRLALLAMFSLAGPALAGPDDRQRNDAIFEFGRAKYFHALVAARGCEAVLPARTRALNARYDAAFAGLAKVFGVAEFDTSIPETPLDGVGQAACDGTLLGFEDKVATLEKRVGQGK